MKRYKGIITFLIYFLAIFIAENMVFSQPGTANLGIRKILALSILAVALIINLIIKRRLN